MVILYPVYVLHSTHSTFYIALLPFHIILCFWPLPMLWMLEKVQCIFFLHILLPKEILYSVIMGKLTPVVIIILLYDVISYTTPYEKSFHVFFMWLLVKKKKKKVMLWYANVAWKSNFFKVCFTALWRSMSSSLKRLALTVFIRQYNII